MERVNPKGHYFDCLTVLMAPSMIWFSHVALLFQILFAHSAQGWIIPVHRSTNGAINRKQFSRSMSAPSIQSNVKGEGGSLHGQDSCFLPLKQLEMDYDSPRIIQIAGSYPGLSRQDFLAVTSEPSSPKGQWTYDFSDPDGPQLGTVALEGSPVVAGCQDPVVVIAEHPSLGVQLPSEIDGSVDLVVLVDRAKNYFGERKFLVVDDPSNGISIAAYGSKAELPNGAEILGQVDLVQIPWLPAMAPTKTGFMEADEYF